MAASFATEPASKQQMRLMLAVSGAMIFAALIVGHYADVKLAPVPAFLPSFATAVAMTDLMTAYLYIVQFRLVARAQFAVLASGYLFTGLLVVAQMLVFPGVLADHGLLGAGPQSAIWLWVSWHCGFPLFVLGFAITQWSLPAQAVSARAVWWCDAAIGALVPTSVFLLLLLVTKGQAWLPELISNGRYVDLRKSDLGPLTLILNGGALLAVIGVTRCRTVADLGLVIAILASVIDSVLTLQGGERFSLGWYGGRINAVISAFSVLLVFIRELTLLYARLSAVNIVLERTAMTDGLTNLANRLHFDHRLASDWASAARRRAPLSVLMVDVDHFKRYNDRYGHQGGDECLRQIAASIRAGLNRTSDLGARYGGEEFVALLPDTDAAGAERVAVAIQADLRARALPHDHNTPSRRVTVSIGVASMVPNGVGEAKDLVRAADIALYQAKLGGRDRTVLAPAQHPSYEKVPVD
jgi:diguanylate cyclase (GGDEF)-like protein